MKFLRHIILTLLLVINMTIIFAAPQEIKFATEATYPPFEMMNAAGNIQGFDVDVIKAICEKTSLQCTFINQSFDSLIPSLQLGKFDAIFGAMNITAEREKQVDFTEPYYMNTASILALKTKNLTLEPQSLAGKTIGVQAGTTLVNYLQDKYGDKIKVNTYASEQAAFLDFTSGRVDAVIGDTPLIQQWLQKNNKGQYTIVGAPIQDKKYFGKGYGIAVKKGNTELLHTLNKGLKAIKADGTLEKIQQHYFGNSAS